MLRKIIAGCIVAGMVLGLLGGCSSGKKTVTVTATDNGWDSQRFHNAVAEVIIEHAFDGYAFELSTASSTMNWQSMLTGEVDVDIESWTDNVASYPEDVAKGDILDIGILVPDSRQGIYVPRYVIEGDPERGIEPMAPGLVRVADLKQYASVFPDDEDPGRGRLYGAMPGWMADEVLYKKYEYYGLDETFNYVRLGSEATQFASIASAYNLGDAWVGYLYEPTWVTGKMDLVLLEDAPYEEAAFLEGKTAFSSQMLKIVCSRQFPEKAPDILEFFKRYETGSALVSSALAYLDETGATHADTAIWFLKEHDELIDRWLSAESAKKLRSYLNGQ